MKNAQNAKYVHVHVHVVWQYHITIQSEWEGSSVWRQIYMDVIYEAVNFCRVTTCIYVPESNWLMLEDPLLILCVYVMLYSRKMCNSFFRYNIFYTPPAEYVLKLHSHTFLCHSCSMIHVAHDIVTGNNIAKLIWG